MVNEVRRIRSFIVGGAACVVLTACGPRFVPVETLSGYSQGAYAQQGYSQTDYSQGAYGQPQQTQIRSRYGDQSSVGLRAPCAPEVYAPCGFMRVLPVYPVYQVVTPIQQETIVEVPAVSEPEPTFYYEPEPVPAYEPAPVYEPAPYHWPEPEVEIPSWKPLRK